MSNALVVPTLFNALVAAVNTAWSNPIIEFGRARTKQGIPYARIWWEQVTVEMSGTTATLLGTNQTYNFGILGRFPFPTDPTQIVELLKVDKANELIALIQTGANFATIGVLPIVHTIDPGEQDDPGEGAYEVTLMFQCYVQATHH